MKIRIACLFLTATVFFNIAVNVFAQGTSFTYQGRLYDGTNPANGKYDLRFYVYNASTLGLILAGPLTNAPVVVSNGLFIVNLDFGGGLFNGQTCWLDIAARSNGVAIAYTSLIPRQQVTLTPYAIFAEGANAAGLSGTVPAADLSGTYNGAVSFNNPGNLFTGNGGGVTNVNAQKLGGLTAAQFWQLGGNAGTTAGVNYLGTPDNVALEIHVNNIRGLRIEPDPAFSTPNVIGGSPANFVGAGSVGNFIGAGSQGGFATNFIVGGNLNTIGGGWDNHITNGYDNTIAGGEYNTIGGINAATVGGGYGNEAIGAYAVVPGGYNNTAAGSYSFAAGYNALASNNGSFVWADSSSTTPFASTANNQFLIRSSFVGVNRATQVSGNEIFGLYSPVTNTWAGMYIQTGSGGRPFYGYSSAGNAWTELDGTDGNKWKLYNSGFWLSLTPAGNFGIGTMSPSQALEVANGNCSLDNGDLLLSNTIVGLVFNNNSYGLAYRSGLPGISPDGPVLYGYNGGALAGLAPNTVALSWDFQGNIWVSNNCSVKTLTIRGGADLAEPFKISSPNGEVPQGAVVVIDETNPGHLKLSSQPYDTRVAGVVSGANGISPGIQMQQQGLVEGGKNVALTGRVYVQADASTGAIKPGDMLTTSSTPGYAMKVRDHARAAGAILGKAMTGLSEGKGMVLVLVTLQ
jgi:hypothetical protein